VPQTDDLPAYLVGSVLVLVGPTGVGKTHLALALAQRLPVEIVNADSRQVYRYMDIGTAKPTLGQRAAVTHHLFDIRDPDQVLTAAEYQRLASLAIETVLAQGRIPVLTGGTPLYVRSIVHNLRFPEVAPDPQLRAQLERDLASRGVARLFQRLADLDPETAAVTDPRNGRRIVRALEIFLKTGKSKRRLEGKRSPVWPLYVLGLTCPRRQLHQRVDARLDAMMAEGLCAEAQRLLDKNYDPALPALQALGYRSLIRHLQGKLGLSQAVQQAKHQTHRYIRHQYTGFRRLEEVVWFDVSRISAGALAARLAVSWPAGPSGDAWEPRPASIGGSPDETGHADAYKA